MQDRCSGDFYVIAKRFVVAGALALTAMLTSHHSRSVPPKPTVPSMIGLAG